MQTKWYLILVLTAVLAASVISISFADEDASDEEEVELADEDMSAQDHSIAPAGKPVPITCDPACEEGYICKKGECVVDKKACDDGNPCTTGDTMVKGECQGTPVAASTSCLDGAGFCDGNGNCMCGTGDACDSPELCNGGSCLYPCPTGADVDCPVLNEYQYSACTNYLLPDQTVKSFCDYAWCPSGTGQCDEFSSTCEGLDTNDYCGSCYVSCSGEEYCDTNTKTCTITCEEWEQKCDEECVNLNDPNNCYACDNVCGATEICDAPHYDSETFPDPCIDCASIGEIVCTETNPLTGVEINTCNCGSCGTDCEEGQVCFQDSCCTPQTEVCDGVDNDCDGVIDECGTEGDICWHGECTTPNDGMSNPSRDPRLCTSGYVDYFTSTCKPAPSDGSADGEYCDMKNDVCASGCVAIPDNPKGEDYGTCGGCLGESSGWCGTVDYGGVECCDHCDRANNMCTAASCGTTLCTNADGGKECCGGDYPNCIEGTGCQPCEEGQLYCGGACTDTSTNAANCGACGNACSGETPACIGGVCSCTDSSCPAGQNCDPTTGTCSES